MNLDDELCFCFHVTRRKVVNYLRIHQPRTASLLSECHGAGTGCGWCRSQLAQMWQQHRLDRPPAEALPSAEESFRRRAAYLRAGKGTPPADAP